MSSGSSDRRHGTPASVDYELSRAFTPATDNHHGASSSSRQLRAPGWGSEAAESFAALSNANSELMARLQESEGALEEQRLRAATAEAQLRRMKGESDRLLTNLQRERAQTGKLRKEAQTPDMSPRRQVEKSPRNERNDCGNNNGNRGARRGLRLPLGSPRRILGSGKRATQEVAARATLPAASSSQREIEREALASFLSGLYEGAPLARPEFARSHGRAASRIS